jgi:hypothetical protein
LPGYLNRFVDLDLSEYGEGCYIRIHNPKVVPQSMLEPDKKIVVGADGKPVDSDAAQAGTQEVLARLVKDWQVYDATCFDDEQPLLSLPATPDLIRRLPFGVLAQLNKLVTDAIPNPS